MNQKLPSVRLAEPVRRAPWIIGGVLAAGAIVSAITFGPAFAAQLNPTPSPTATVIVDTAPVLSASDLSSIRQAANDQQATIAKDAADAAAKASADAAAAAAAKKASTHTAPAPSAGLPAGSVVPDIPGTTSPDTTKCASGTASDNASGVPVCD